MALLTNVTNLFSVSSSLRSINLIAIVIKMLLALLFGGTIGLERGIKGRAAGFRTHILVCIGSAMVMLTNQYAYEIYGGDPTRMGAQVISGIGFLGAGTIIVTGRHQIKGLTTAASLWACACLGLTVGIGFYEGAIISWAMILVANTFLHNMGDRISSKAKVNEFYIEFQTVHDLTNLIQNMREMKVSIGELELTKSINKADPTIGAVLSALPDDPISPEVLAELMQNLDGVNFVEPL